MKATPKSIEELINGCSAYGFTAGLPRTLTLDGHTDWELVSGTIHHNGCQAQLVSRPEQGEAAFRVSWRCSHQGEYGHIELLTA